MGDSSVERRVITVDGIDVTLTRKRVKNINLRVDHSGNVLVSAPARVSQRTIEEFVTSRLAWIKSARSRVQRERKQMEHACTEGATIYLWGEPMTIRFDATAKPKGNARFHFEKEDGKLAVFMRAADSSDDQARERAFDRWLKTELMEHVSVLLPICEQLVGRSCGMVRIRRMKSRWGSCNTKTGVITLNASLVHYDRRCLSYVITHELCHLHEPSHNKRFHQLMDAFCPDWRECRALLNSK
ncbi:MAG: M48 family metallopeptidase [Atopobiaceae bacterium]|nr:M48 family metallopeptidase [Atopobiaceae bacterium]